MSQITRIVTRCAFTTIVVMAAVPKLYAQVQSENQPAAITLEKKADAMLGDRAKWSTLARLFYRAADMRGVNDLRAVDDLILSAGARAAAGDKARAQDTYQQAAEWALAMGDVERAGSSFMTAAVLAVDLKDIPMARLLRERGERLTLSPLLSPAQKTAIRSHFTSAANIALAN